jgi:hypothetical protein
MKTIEYRYAPDGIAIADEACEETARLFLELKGDQTIRVATGLFIDAIRALIYEGFVPHTDVCFVFRGEILHPDRNGRLASRPNGFCDTHDRILRRLLKKKSDGPAT